MSEIIECVAQAICGDDNPANVLEIHRVRARKAIEAMPMPSLSELAEVIHDARFGPDYPPHLVNSFDSEGLDGQDYCYRLARAVMTHFRVSARSLSNGDRDNGR